MTSAIGLYNGNQMLASGAYACGVQLVTGYPGTPITGALEALRGHSDVHVTWGVNEKAAFEVALGAAVAGGRALCVMKTLGLNVAADAYLQSAGGCFGGALVVAVADDVGRELGDDEQDARLYGMMAGLPVLEPGDGEEVRTHVRFAFAMSEAFGVPVLVRMTTLTCQQTGSYPVEPPPLEVQLPVPPLSAPPDRFFGQKTVASIVDALLCWGHPEKVTPPPDYDDRLRRLARCSTHELLASRLGDPGEVQVVTSGAWFQTCRSIMPDARYLKLGQVWPLAPDAFADLDAARPVVVVEQHAPVLERELLARGFRDVRGVSRYRERFGGQLMTAERLTAWLTSELGDAVSQGHAVGEDDHRTIPAPRLPENCPGCPHLSTYRLLEDLGCLTVSGIGCGGLAAFPIMASAKVVQSMGSAFNIARGLTLISPEDLVVAVMGDGEFWHSGLLGLLDAVNQSTRSMLVVLDNNFVAMTGGQLHPSSITQANRLDIAAACRGLGVQHVVTADPLSFGSYRKVLADALAFDGPAVVIAQSPCVKFADAPSAPPLTIDDELCLACDLCLRLGCPAVQLTHDPDDCGYRIRAELCTGCGLCREVCPADAIGEWR